MTAHHHRLPKRGGRWQPDPHQDGWHHRAGNAWNQVRPPSRNHHCVAQSKQTWQINTKAGNHVVAVVWCACGSVTYPGMAGRWLGKNMRRRYCGATLPVWHRAMADVRNGPATMNLRDSVPPQHDDAESVVSQAGRATVEATAPPPLPPVVRPPHPGRAHSAGVMRTIGAGRRSAA